MSETLFGAEAPVIEAQDQETDAGLEQLKAKFVKEDGSIDVDALLKKAYNADLHIPKIESENANLRKKVDESLTYQDLLDKINAQPRQPASNHGQPADDERGGNPTGVATEKDLEALVEKTFSKKQQEALQVQNMQYVAGELSKAWGANFEQKLRQIGAGLGLSESRLRDMIRNEPKVLLALTLPQVQTKVDNSYVPPVTGTRNTAQSNVPTRNWNYYKAMMKNDRKRYDSQQIQDEMHKSAHELGERFYS